MATEKALIEILKELKKEGKGLDRKLEGLLSGGGWKSFQEGREELRKKRQDLLAVENQILNELSSIRRPFKKLDYEHGEELPAEHRKCLKEYLESPMSALVSDHEMERLRSLLESLRERIKQGGISLKDREREKIDSLRERIDPEISGLRERYMELENRIRESGPGEQGSQDLVARKEWLREGVEKNKREIERLIMESTGKRLRIS